MICFMFPGQPLTREAELPTDLEWLAISTMVRERTGLDLTTASWQGDPATDQVLLQVYGTAVSFWRYRQVRQQKQPAIIAEHSMGIYPALAAVGALPEAEALELTCRIGRALSRMGETETYHLGCVIGLSLAQTLVVADNHGIFLANHNTSRHYLVAGQQHRVEAAMAEALAAGAFSVRLFPCDAPLHTPLIAAIVPELRAIVGDYRFAEPTIPLMEHIGQDFLTAADIPDFLVEELCRPVNWEATCLALGRAGISQYVEVGCGEALKKYNRWIASENQ